MLGARTYSPTIQTSVKFRDFTELYHSSFQQITFTPGTFTYLKVFFPAMLMDFRSNLSQSKVKKIRAICESTRYSLVEPEVCF